MEDRPDPTPFLALLAEAQGRARTADVIYAALDEALAGAVGHILCSIARHEDDGAGGRCAVRVHSNQPALYPVGARKRAADAPRIQALIDTGEAQLVTDPADFRRSYPDGAGAGSLGCGTAVNTPVLWQGRVLGQVNLMHRPGWYGPADLARIRAFTQLLVPVFLHPHGAGS